MLWQHSPNENRVAFQPFQLNDFWNESDESQTDDASTSSQTIQLSDKLVLEYQIIDNALECTVTYTEQGW